MENSNEVVSKPFNEMVDKIKETTVLLNENISKMSNLHEQFDNIYGDLKQNDSKMKEMQKSLKMISLVLWIFVVPILFALSLYVLTLVGKMDDLDKDGDSGKSNKGSNIDFNDFTFL